MQTNLPKILKENKIKQQDLLKSINKVYAYPIKTHRLSQICLGKADDIRARTIFQIIDGLKRLGVIVTPNDILQNENSADLKW